MAFEIPIANLIPFEKQLTRVQYEKAVADLKRDGKFDPPAKVLLLSDGVYILRDGHHHVRAALDLGYDVVPCELTSAPEILNQVMQDFESHDALRGLVSIPILDGSRREAIQREMREQRQNDFLESLKQKLEKK
jgi:hypothetical protein